VILRNTSLAPRCRKGPSTPSLDHLVGAAKQRERDGEAQRPRSPEVDDQLDLGGLLDWQVGRPLALEDSPGVDASQAIAVGNADP